MISRPRPRTAATRTASSSRATKIKDTGDKGGERQRSQAKNNDGAKMTVQLTNAQLQDLIAGCIAGAGGGAAGAAGTMSAASMVGPMGPCILGKDKLKRPKKWADWHHEAENKMRFCGITDGGRKLDFLRSCAGAELTKLWDKEGRVVDEATGDGAERLEADT